MVTRQDYESDAVQAARAVAIELTHLLSEYRENIVLIGGWVPELLCPQAEEAYVGSLDVDLALDHRRLTEAEVRYPFLSGMVHSHRGYGPYGGREGSCSSLLSLSPRRRPTPAPDQPRRVRP